MSYDYITTPEEVLLEAEYLRCLHEIEDAKTDEPYLGELIAEAEDAAYDHHRTESARQARIAAGVEHACSSCGCSESQACPGGCIWVRPNFCSACWKRGVR